MTRGIHYSVSLFTFAVTNRLFCMANSISQIRSDYSLRSLDASDVDPDPIVQFDRWWKEALESEIVEVNAMTLCTISPEGKPTGRIVLLKGFDERGFVFFTNYQSNKGKALSAHPDAALVFFWKELERQVRIEGTVTKLSSGESDDYFYSRPEGSRIGAWASPQSEVIPDRERIEKNVSSFQAKFGKEPIPRPPHWGGYLVKPSAIEFWQGRPSRLHDRIFYSQTPSGEWQISRLAP